MDERQILEQEIRNLECDLAASDYKILKCYESELMGQSMPYDVAAVHAERQAKRDRINEIKEILDGALSQNYCKGV